jgi:hypothetical protein
MKTTIATSGPIRTIWSGMNTDKPATAAIAHVRIPTCPGGSAYRSFEVGPGIDEGPSLNGPGALALFILAAGVDRWGRGAATCFTV